MKLLLIALPDSVHTARWISQLSDLGWEIHLFPSKDLGLIHPQMAGVKAYVPLYGKRRCSRTVRICGLPVFNDFLSKGISSAVSKMAGYRQFQLNRLLRVIRKVKPDLIHCLELQQAGYLALEAKKLYSGTFPPLIVTNWGSDIYLFGRLPGHESRIRELLAASDYYSCECRRDVCLAKAYGFNGTVLPVFPNAGGFDMEQVQRLRQRGPVSDRRLIMLKGYQHWAGRALVGLRALERCADVLGEYEVAVYGASADVVLAAELFSKSTGIATKIIPLNSPHEEILRHHGLARVSIGLSISDGISTSLLEALVMGAFPIQSWTACADEWIEDGVTGLMVPPEDPDVIEKAIRRALADDAMVENAAQRNYELAQNSLAHSILKQKAVELYQTVLDDLRLSGDVRCEEKP
ncbi:glycosyltransferase [Geomonas agri]|uniref:glycosyltransferase n=1 Tax=Geomonas agri TaxID=2873702 RepID=UPI001CD6FBF5|nr:glycosyltransferase [Geomonas agri]